MAISLALAAPSGPAPRLAAVPVGEVYALQAQPGLNPRARTPSTVPRTTLPRPVIIAAKIASLAHIALYALTAPRAAPKLPASITAPLTGPLPATPVSLAHVLPGKGADATLVEAYVLHCPLYNDYQQWLFDCRTSHNPWSAVGS